MLYLFKTRNVNFFKLLKVLYHNKFELAFESGSSHCGVIWRIDKFDKHEETYWTMLLEAFLL